MRRLLLFFLLPLSLVVNAKEKDVEKVLGTYWNSYSNKSLQVSAIVDKDNEITLFLEIPVNHRGVQEMKLEIEEENIPILKETLLDMKDLRWQYRTYLKNEGITETIEFKMDNKLPRMRLWWKVGDYWKFSVWEKRCKPKFLLEKGYYYVYIEEQTNRSTLKEDLTSAAITSVLGALLGIPEDMPTYVSEPEYITFKWGWSTQDDFNAIINWLDIEKLKSKYKAKK